METKISVIIIGYNIENFIEQCINSVISQSFDEFEIIFVNDGSQDDTLKIANKYRDKIFVVDKDNGGIISARKAGLRLAKGEYVMFVDGDDWLNIECLDNLYSPIKSKKSVDIVCSNYFFQNIDNSFKQENVNYTGRDECEGFDFLQGILLDKIDHHMFPKLYRREFILNAGYLDYPEVTVAEDLLANVFFGVYKPRTLFLDSVNYFYRYNTSSVIRRGGEKLLEQIETLRYIEKFLCAKTEINFTQEVGYSWFSYTWTYVLSNIEPTVKKKIMYAFKKKKISYLTNKYCLETLDVGSRKDRLRKLYFKLAFALPVMIPIFDNLVVLLKSVRCKKAKWLSEYHKAEMDLLYDRYLDNIVKYKFDKNIFLIGTSDRSNIGDHLIAFSEMEFLRQICPDYMIHEITGDTFRNKRNIIRNIIKKDDIICITGGGFLGDLWPDEEYMVNAVLEDFVDNKVLILPQTVFFYDGADSSTIKEKLKNYLNHKKLYLMARDKSSYELYARYFTNDKIGLFPDMALYVDGIKEHESSNDVMICMRCDKERTFSRYDMDRMVKSIKSMGFNIIYSSTLAEGRYNGDIRLDKRNNAIKDKLAEFSKPKLIITDRLHGMILSTIAGTPCIVFDNISQKVSGVYNLWMSHLESISLQRDTKNIDNILAGAIEKRHFTYSSSYLDCEREKFIDFMKKAIGE